MELPDKATCYRALQSKDPRFRWSDIRRRAIYRRLLQTGLSGAHGEV